MFMFKILYLTRKIDIVVILEYSTIAQLLQII